MAVVMRALLGAVLAVVCCGAHLESKDNPVQKVVELLGTLKASVIADGKAEEKGYKEYMKWCDEASDDCGFRIKTHTKEKAELEAKINKCTADQEVCATQISKLAADISTAEEHLKNATSIRKMEHTDFVAIEDELVEAVDMLGRAIKVLEREMAKNPALLQKTVDSSNVQSLVQTVGMVIEAASFRQNDRKKLLALVQSRQSQQEQEDEEDKEDEMALGAPEPDAYKTHSGNIVEVLEDMKEKAEEQLAAARKSEMEALHNYELLSQSLRDQITDFSKELEDTKSDKAKAEECIAASKEALQTAEEALAQAKKELEIVEHDCSSATKDHEVSVASRKEEIGAIDKASEIVSTRTSGAVEEAYSFVQLQSSSKMTAGAEARAKSNLMQLKLLKMVKHLADEYKTADLVQLTSKISSVLKFGGSEDPFKKVKGLIEELIERLKKEAAAEAAHKAYCDAEMKHTSEKKESLSDDIDDITGKVDQAIATTTKLKEQVAELQQEIAAIVKRQADMDQARKDEHAAFVKAEKDLKEGLAAVQEATRVLRDYYSSDEEESFLQDGSEATPPPPPTPTTHSKSGGAGKSIIAILEQIASDFSKELAEDTIAEEEAQSQYDKMTQENKVSKAQMSQDVKYKSKRSKALDKEIAELTSDKEGLQTELNAVLEYWEKLTAQCVAKPETYEERIKRRAAEIAGLKEALGYLSGEASLLQRGASHTSTRHLRSISQH